jgi:hypothetical protein
MQDQLLRIAKEQDRVLREIDEKLLRQLTSGQSIDVSIAKEEVAVSQKDQEEVFLIKADLIAWLCKNPEALSLVPSYQGIEVIGAVIQGDLDLQYTKIPFPIIFKRCTFEGEINLNNSEICSLDLSGSKTNSINCEGVKVQNSVYFRDSFYANGEINLSMSLISGVLDCSGANFFNPGKTALLADRMRIKGWAYFRNGFQASGMVSLVNAEIEGNLECNQGVFENPKKVAINAERMKVAGDVFFCTGSWSGHKSDAKDFRADGEVKLVKAQVGGTLECRGGRFINNEDTPALNAKGIQVQGDVLLHNGFIGTGGVNLVGAEIGGNLECKQGTFENKDKIALDAERMKVDGDVFFCEDSWDKDEENKDATGFIAEGEVKLVGANITGYLNCAGGKFEGTYDHEHNHKNAITATNIVVQGSILFCVNFRAEGKVSLVGARIGGNLECNSGSFESEKKISLDAERIQIGGDVYLCKGNWNRKNIKPDGPFGADGLVNFISANIYGTVKCEGASFSGKSKVNFYGADIKREFVWTNIAGNENVTLDLRFAHIMKLIDDKDSWPDAGKLLLNGLTYEDASFFEDQQTQVPKEETDVIIKGFIKRRYTSAKSKIAGIFTSLLQGFRPSQKFDDIISGLLQERKNEDILDRIEWLNRQGGKFEHQPYEQYAAILQKNGQEKDAADVLIAKAKERARRTDMFMFSKFWDWTLGKLIGYGYRPWRALKISIAVIILGTFIFGFGHNAGIVGATKLVEYVSPENNRDLVVRNEYPKFNAVMYSLDMFIPLVDLRQASYWLPCTNDQESGRETDSSEDSLDVRMLRGYMWMHILGGWLLTTLLVVGLSGLVKR